MKNSDKSDSNRQRLRGKVVQALRRKLLRKAGERPPSLYVQDPDWSGTVRSSLKARDSHTEGKTAQVRMGREDTEGSPSCSSAFFYLRHCFGLQTAAPTCTKNFLTCKFGSLIPK